MEVGLLEQAREKIVLLIREFEVALAPPSKKLDEDSALALEMCDIAQWREQFGSSG